MAYTYLTPYRRGGSSLFELHNQMNRMFDELLGPDARNRAGGGKSGGKGSDKEDKEDGVTSWPSLEIAQDDGQITVCAELAGMDRDDIEIGMDDGMLTLTGKKERRSQSDNGYSEFAYGRFERQVSIPSSIDLEQATASFDNGLLTITLPKKEDTGSGRKIEIGGGNGQERIGQSERTSGKSKAGKEDANKKDGDKTKKDADNKQDKKDD